MAPRRTMGTRMPAIGGVLLCGGQSRRMGQPKAWLPIAGEPLLCRVARQLAEVVAPVVVVAAPEQPLPPLPGDIRIVYDERPNRGPLQGMATGIRAVAEECEAVFVSACDVPLLRPSFIRTLCEQLGDELALVPWANHQAYPLSAIYRVSVLPTIDQFLREDRLRVRDLLLVVPTRYLTPADFATVDPQLESLCNVNTPEEYAQSLRTLGLEATADTLAERPEPAEDS